MGSHDPFEYLKHKVWPKERLGIKVPIWFPTTKSQESPWFVWMQMACHISLERFQWGIQLCFKPQLNWRSSQKVMSFQSCKSPNFGNFGIHDLEVPGQNDIWVQPPWLGIENITRGKVVASPKFGPWWVLWVSVCLWFVRAPKVL